MAKKTKVKPPDTGEQSELRDKLADLDAVPPRSLKSEQDAFRNEFTSRLSRIVVKQQTIQQDFDRLKDGMPERVTPEILNLQRRAETDQSSRKDLENKLDDGITDVKIQHRQLKNEVVSLGNTTSAVQNVLTAHIDEANNKIAALQAVDNLIGAAIDGNIHLYAAQEVIEVSKALIDPGYTDTYGIALVEEVEGIPLPFTANTDDTIDITAHGLVAEQRVRVRNQGGALPAGLVAGTVYYVMWIDADTIKVTVDPPGTDSPSAVDITGTGTGLHALDPIASRNIHTKANKLLALSIGTKTTTPAFTVDEVVPTDGEVQWDLIPQLRPRLADGECLFRIVWPSGTYNIGELVELIIDVGDIMGNTIATLTLTFLVVA